MGLIDDIPVRSNADTGLVNASWWNVIRTALIGVLGAGVTSPAQQTLTDNATTAVTNLILASGSIIWARVRYTCLRNGVRQSGRLILHFNTQWDIGHDSEDDVGVSFSIHATTGQVSGILTSTGFNSTIQWAIESTFAPEV